MAKFIPTTISAGLNSANTINENFQSVADLLSDRVLFRDNIAGEPNHMENALDMNSNKLLNVADGTAAGDGVNRGQLDTLLSGTRSAETIVATSNGQTVFNFGSLTYTPGSQVIFIYINGVYQPRDTYTETDEDTITLGEGINTGDSLRAVVLFD